MSHAQKLILERLGRLVMQCNRGRGIPVYKCYRRSIASKWRVQDRQIGGISAAFGGGQYGI